MNDNKLTGELKKGEYDPEDNMRYAIGGVK